MTEDRQKIIDKIRALMAKANDKGATEAESVLFMQKALDLLAKHNLEEIDIEVKEEIVPIDTSEFQMNADLSWFSKLANVTSKMYFCRFYRTKKFAVGYKTPRNYYCFVGKEQNRFMTVNMFEYLMKTMHRLAVAYSDNVAVQYDFKKGCATRLTYLIWQINVKNTTENPVEKTGLPALYNQELALVDEFLKDMQFKTAKKTSLKNKSFAFYDGSQAANSISLNNQIGSSSSSNNKFLLK